MARVSELDAFGRVSSSENASVESMLEYAARVMGSYVNTTLAGSATDLVISADAADAIASSSSLLQAVYAANPSIAAGPIDIREQRWTKTGSESRSRSKGTPAPSVEEFVQPVSDASVERWGPPGFGLYSSTACTPDGKSMWRTYLDLYEGSTLFPLPWTTWALRVEGAPVIAEIDSARSWTEFVATYPLHRNGLLYPDWVSAARSIDGVHFSLRAIIAAQSFTFQTTEGIIASSYWDVESTFWLNWRIIDSKLIEIVE